MAVYVTGDPNPYNMSEVILTIYNVVVKGYHECPFSVELDECFVAQKKRGDCGNALKVLHTSRGRGQLGHLQRDLVAHLFSDNSFTFLAYTYNSSLENF